MKYIRILYIISVVLWTTVSSAPCPNVHIHQEWRMLTPRQQQDYMNALVCMHKTPSILWQLLVPSPSLYDDHVYSHGAAAEDTHGTPIFLPWHRLFISVFDENLRRYCGYHGPMPFWDWTLDSVEPENSPVLQDFGGNGNEQHDQCIQKGPFVGMAITFPYPAPCIQRDWSKPDCRFKAPTFSATIIDYVLSASNHQLIQGTFSEFRTRLEQ